MAMTFEEMRKNKIMKILRQNRIRRVKQIDEHAAYPMEMKSKVIRMLRRNKMRMSRQNKMRISRQKRMRTSRKNKMRMLRRKKKMGSVKEMNIEDALPYLPEELVIENILTRLSLRPLAQYSCISKLCYNSIFNDARFAKTHFVHSKNHNLNLVFNLLNVSAKGGASFFSLDNDYKFRLLMDVASPHTTELVGYCNGLACVTLLRKATSGLSLMMVVNPVKKETLTLPFYYPNDGVYLCHGFGFDSSTDEYKVAMIYISKDNQEFISMVFTLGTNSWRKIVTSVAQISAQPGCSPFPSVLVTRAATLCGGDLFWRITRVGEEETLINNNHNEVDNSKVGMLLSFDIHKEKIQIIRFPIECSLTPTPSTMNIVVEHHIMEYRGYLCVAQSEKAMRNIIHRCCHCDNCQSNCCCCCCCRFTVQLYMLKDKEKQVWIKGETLGVQVRELGLLPASFCCYFDAATATTASFPTRILSLSDQVLLHWFDGKCIKIYNLQTKRLEVVTSFSSCNSESSSLFEVKMNASPPAKGIDDEGIIYCPHMDYQLDTQAENIVSLKTFIPAGETSTFYGNNDYLPFLKLQIPAGWVNTTRELVKFHAFF